jgi:uncharacterized Fe-S cluster-containing protein
MKSEEVYKVEDIYKLHLGLMKYVDYSDKGFALVVYDYMNIIKDTIDKLKEITRPLDDFISGLKEISGRYVDREGRVSDESMTAYKMEIASYREINKAVIEREQEIRESFRRMLDEEIRLALPMISYDVVPDVFTAQDIEHFKIIIER